MTSDPGPEPFCGSDLGDRCDPDPETNTRHMWAGDDEATAELLTRRCRRCGAVLVGVEVERGSLNGIQRHTDGWVPLDTISADTYR